MSKQLLTTEETAKKMGYSASAFRKRIKGRADFPKAIILHEGADPRWEASEVDQFIELLIKNRGDSEFNRIVKNMLGDKKR